MSAFTKGSTTWCAEHCNEHCRGACLQKLGVSDHGIPHSGRAVAALNCKVRRTWLGGPK